MSEKRKYLFLFLVPFLLLGAAAFYVRNQNGVTVLVLSLGLLFLCLLHAYASLRQELTDLNQLLKRRLYQDYSGHYMGKKDGPVGQVATTFEKLSQLAKSREEEARIAQTNLSLFLSNITLGVVLVNRQKKISIRNQAFADLFPDQGPILGLSLFHLQGGHALTVMANKVLETGQRQSQELLLERESEKIFEVSAVPIFEYNRVQQVLLLLYDVTKIRQLEQMRADFVANASHELRTPITSIRGFAETLIDMGEEDPKKQKFLDIIYRESLRLEDIVNDILKLASAEYSDESGQLEAVAVYQLIEEVSQTLAKKMSKKSLTWVLEGDRALTITCDSKQLSQILLNLLTNAINYTEAGGEISVQFFEEEGRLILQVQDTGIGIPKADQEKIFERFYRVNKGRSRQTGGTGLGLAIVKNMLEKMDGQISLTSQLGEGSTFTISLPKKKPKS